VGRTQASTLVADLVAGELNPVDSSAATATNNSKYFIGIPFAKCVLAGERILFGHTSPERTFYEIEQLLLACESQVTN
jgi:hypothetical protein